MKTIGNIIWFMFFGVWWFILYALLGVVFCITIIGIPIGISLFQFAKLMALPFGKEIVRTRDIKDVHIALNIGARIANFIWFILFGVWCAIANVILGIICCLTIIFIPYGIICFRCAKFILFPVGARVVTKEEAIIEKTTQNIRQEMRKQNKTSAATPIVQPSIQNQTPTAINNVYQQKLLNSTFSGEEMAELGYIFTSSQAAKLIYFPVDNIEDGYWICSCGEKNSSEFCAVCGNSQKDIFDKINREYISQHMSDRIAEENIKRAKEEEEKRKMQEQRRLERHEAMQKNKENAIKAFNKAKETCIPIKNEAVRKSKKFIKWFKGKLEESKEFRVTVISVCAAVILAITVLTLIFKAAAIFVSLAVILAIIILALIFSNF